ncbi:MAG: RNA polymerase sigma factor [Kiritimatiellia bacterium]
MSLFGASPRPAPEALETVVSTYERQLLVYVTRITGNASMAEDIVQETFIKLAGRWRGPLEPGPQVSAWLYKVAYNGAIDVLRRERRRGALHRSFAEEVDETVPPTEGQGGGTLSHEAQRVRDALDALSERERALVVLKVYEERSYKEIAEIAGLSVSNVGFVLHTAMKKLAASLEKGGADDVR